MRMMVERPLSVRTGLDAAGDIIRIELLAYTSDGGIDEPEQAWPSTYLICCPTIRLATATACFGSHASSSITIEILRPLTPPASLIAAAAVSAPRFICSPMLATGPVIGPATAIVMSSALTGAASAASPRPASDRVHDLSTCDRSSVQRFLRDPPN